VRTRAVIFDFNGTISDDEPLLDELFRALFDELGLGFTSETYYEQLAGLSDPEIVARAFEIGGVRAGEEQRAALLARKIDLYKAAVSARPAISPAAVRFVSETARRVPVAIASGAVREEVEHGLSIAGILGEFTAIVCIDDVERGKPDPQGYEMALARLNAAAGPPPVAPAGVLVFEDADAGVRAARAAGMRCVALAGPAYTGTPVAADVVIDALDPALLDALL